MHVGRTTGSINLYAAKFGVSMTKPFLLQLFMRRNSVYIAFILGGAILGERVSNLALLLSVLFSISNN